MIAQFRPLYRRDRPQPSAVIESPLPREESILSKRAFSTLVILSSAAECPAPAVTAPCRRAARGVPFHRVQFGQRRVAFPGSPPVCPADRLTSALRRVISRARRAVPTAHVRAYVDNFCRTTRFSRQMGFPVQVEPAQQFVHLLFYRRFHLGRDQFIFGL